MDESRSQFEDWIEMNFPWRDDRFRLFRGEYMSTWTQNMYRAWQASRQAVEIAMPEPYDDGHGNLWIPQDGIAGNIHAAGLKIKGEP